MIYAFSNPRVRSLLERLMGSNVVRVTDRQYMLGLQIRNREDHEQRVRRRIENRELAEVCCFRILLRRCILTVEIAIHFSLNRIEMLAIISTQK